MAKGKRPAAYGEVQAEIGQRIKWARELVVPTRAEFARLLGMDRSTLIKIEEGKQPPSVFVILDCAHKLRMCPDYFMTGSLRGSDGEMALRLAAAHPELARGLGGTGSGIPTAPGIPTLPRRQERDGRR